MTDQYVPVNASERAYFDSLWVAAHQSADVTSDLSGGDAVAFFRRSNIDTGILRTIWGLCTPIATMNVAQFYTAMRYISLVQAGEMPITREKLQQTMRSPFPPPQFTGIAIPPPAPASIPVSNVAPIAAGPPPYAMMPEDHLKYHNLFLTYDKDGDGYLSAQEASAVFSKSNLENSQLAQIWAMSDLDRDNRLTSKEFALAFHLIVCVGKKKMPVPPGLPPPLQSFVQNAPAIPQGAPAHQPVVQPQTFPSLQPKAPVPVPVIAAPVVSPSAAITSLDPAPFKPTPSISSISVDEQMELEASVRNVADVAKKAVSSYEQTSSSFDKASSSLKYLLQKMYSEKASLSSSLGIIDDDVHKATARLESTLAEISQLQAELEHLRSISHEKRSVGDAVQSRVQTADAERTQLLKSIQELRTQLDQGLESNRAAALRVKDLSVEQAGLGAALDGSAMRASQLQADTQQGRAEVENLRAILASLAQTKGALDESSRSLSAQASALQISNAALRTEVQATASSIASLRSHKSELDEEKTLLTKHIGDATGAPVKPVLPAPVVAPIVPIVTSAPQSVPGVVSASVSTVVVEDVEEDEFDDGAVGTDEVFPEPVKYEAFGSDDFPAPSGAVHLTKDDDAFPPPSTGDVQATGDGFEDFPVPSTAAAFDDFPAPAAPLTDTGFDDGFGDFAAPSVPASAAADDGFPDSDFPPPSGDFSFGEFDSGFVEESFSATHNSPW